MIRLVLLFMMFGHVHAQTSFFISPEISTKIELTSSSAVNNQHHVFNGSPSFEYQNQNVIYPKNFSPVLLGLNLGINLNNKILFSVGASQDGGSSGGKVYFNTFNPNTNIYQNNQISFYKGYSFGRYQLSSQIRFLKKKQNYFFFDLNFGLLHRAGGVSILPEDLEESNQLIDENYGTLKITSEKYKSNSTSFFVSFGLTDKVSINSVYIGDVSLIYLLSKNTMSIVNTKIEVSTALENKSYSFNSISKGNGIHIRFTRNIQFYPWKKTIYDKD